MHGVIRDGDRCGTAGDLPVVAGVDEGKGCEDLSFGHRVGASLIGRLLPSFEEDLQVRQPRRAAGEPPVDPEFVAETRLTLLAV